MNFFEKIFNYNVKCNYNKATTLIYKYRNALDPALKNLAHSTQESSNTSLNFWNLAPKAIFYFQPPVSLNDMGPENSFHWHNKH